MKTSGIFIWETSADGPSYMNRIQSIWIESVVSKVKLYYGITFYSK